MADARDLAAFQEALIGILSAEKDGERIRERLLAHPASVPFRAWVAGCEPRMLAVAAGLVERWAVRG